MGMGDRVTTARLLIELPVHPALPRTPPSGLGPTGYPLHVLSIGSDPRPYPRSTSAATGPTKEWRDPIGMVPYGRVVLQTERDEPLRDIKLMTIACSVSSSGQTFEVASSTRSRMASKPAAHASRNHRASALR